MFLPGVTPYVFGGLGLARMTPTAQFTYTSGTLAGATPSPGDDVTGQLISNGDFTQPASSNALMLSAGGGIDVPLAPRVAVEVGYRFSRIALDLPINAQSIVFGLVVGR
jgi:opacity protein-like surface antigen